jgi:hypothetical protein
VIARCDLGLPKGPVAAERATGVLNEIVARLFARLSSLLADVDSVGLLEGLLSQQEAILYFDTKTRLILPSQAACFGEESTAVREAIRADRDVTSTAICNRFLMECVTAMPPRGERVFSLGLYDEAIALAKQIVEFGMLSDALHHKLSSAKLAVLPSGRLGVSRDEPYHETLAAYVALLSGRTLPLARRSYARHWAGPLNDDDGEPLDPNELNVAFLAEFGAAADQLAELSGELMNISGDAPGQIATWERETLISEIARRLGRSPDQVDTGLEVFSLGPVEAFPPRTNAADVYPWRFSRSRSVARRPVLLRPGPGGLVEAVFGPRTVLRSGHYLLEQINAGRLEPISEAMRAYMTKVRRRANDAFNREVAEAFRGVDDARVSENVRRFGKLRLGRDNGEDIGDIDVLVVSPGTKVLLIAEVKDF